MRYGANSGGLADLEHFTWGGKGGGAKGLGRVALAWVNGRPTWESLYVNGFNKTKIRPIFSTGV